MSRRLLAAALLALAPVPAIADDGIFSEMKIGAALHDTGPFISQKESEGFDVNVEILFRSPTFLGAILSPRPHLGASVHTAGATSQLYAGLTWTFDLVDGVFVAASLGGAVHDGKLETTRSDRKALGTRFLFREAIELGIRLGPSQRHSISVGLSHVSNAGISDTNEGMETVALRYGYRF